MKMQVWDICGYRPVDLYFKKEYSDLATVNQEADMSLTFTLSALSVPAAVHY